MPRDEIPVTPESLKRFGDRLVTEGDCIVYQGTRVKEGYGQFKFKGACMYAHRFAFKIAYGDIPEGILVLHKCDNPPCVLIDHLFGGTQKMNMQDCMNKGRHWRGHAKTG
jgi:hypothetical protein